MSTADQNKRALLELLAASDAGDVDKALSFYAPDYEDHDASEARAGRCPRSALREAFQLFRSSFTQTRHVVDILLAQDDLVAALIRVEATHSKELFGVPATGARVSNDSLVIYRFEGGRIRERWCRERQSTRQLLESAALPAHRRGGDPPG
ncbi:MAG TPA: ester cyclase [Steroidobacteraceae bacterium]|nr:ester cyclase [Steroidobacteraceae bacterium]